MINWGVSMRQGARRVMEDAYEVTENSEELFFGIYDGHNGNHAAKAAAHGLDNGEHYVQSLRSLIAESSLSGQERYVRAFHEFDDSFRLCQDRSGTTAMIAHIKLSGNEPHVYLAWAGDTRAVLIGKDFLLDRGGLTEVSCDHKPDRADEKERIKEAEGFVTNYGCSRVGGLLAVSRSLGDAQVKGLVKGVIATPEIKRIRLDSDYYILVLATDGVWDVLSNKQAAKVVCACLSLNVSGKGVPEKSHEYTAEDGNDSRMTHAARMLRDAAKEKGSTDNISVAVVELHLPDRYRNMLYKSS